MFYLFCCPSPQSLRHFLYVVARRSPPHAPGHLLECSHGQRLLGGRHAGFQRFDFELASFDERRDIKVPILIQGFVGGLS